jgi:hypothetical protein
LQKGASPAEVAQCRRLAILSGRDIVTDGFNEGLLPSVEVGESVIRKADPTQYL